jgi:hypothetical protein
VLGRPVGARAPDAPTSATLRHTGANHDKGSIGSKSVDAARGLPFASVSRGSSRGPAISAHKHLVAAAPACTGPSLLAVHANDTQRWTWRSLFALWSWRPRRTYWSCCTRLTRKALWTSWTRCSLIAFLSFEASAQNNEQSQHKQTPRQHDESLFIIDTPQKYSALLPSPTCGCTLSVFCRNRFPIIRTTRLCMGDHNLA